jgi:hypothetical protein
VRRGLRRVWIADEQSTIRRLGQQSGTGVITNDPRLFAAFV